MAIRYSGDAEVRLHYNARKKRYSGTVTDPIYHWRGECGTSFWHRDYRSSDAYDDAARELLEMADKAAVAKRNEHLMVERKRGRVRVRRVFQAPCPM